MPVLPLNQAGGGTRLPSLSCAVRRPLNQSMNSTAALLSVAAWTVGQPVEMFVVRARDRRPAGGVVGAGHVHERDRVAARDEVVVEEERPLRQQPGSVV